MFGRAFLTRTHVCHGSSPRPCFARKRSSLCGERCTMLDRRQMGWGLGATVIATALSGKLWAAAPIKPDEASALLVIDVQNCFLPGGSLAVKDGEQVVPDHQPHRQGLCQCGADAGLAHRGPRLVRDHPIPARSRSRPSVCPTASRCCGPITACRAPRARRCRRTSRSRRPGSSSARVSTRKSTAIRPSPRPTARPRPGSPPI